MGESKDIIAFRDSVAQQLLGSRVNLENHDAEDYTMKIVFNKQTFLVSLILPEDGKFKRKHFSKEYKAGDLAAWIANKVELSQTGTPSDADAKKPTVILDSLT